MVGVSVSAALSVTVPDAEPLVADPKPVNVAPAVDDGLKFKITPADVVDPEGNGPWMWPLFTIDVSPLNVTLYVKTFVDVSSVAVNVPLPLGLPVSAPGSPAGVSDALNFTIFETGGVDVSEPQATAAAASAANESVSQRVCIGVSLGVNW